MDRRHATHGSDSEVDFESDEFASDGELDLADDGSEFDEGGSDDDSEFDEEGSDELEFELELNEIQKEEEEMIKSLSASAKNDLNKGVHLKNQMVSFDNRNF